MARLPRSMQKLDGSPTEVLRKAEAVSLLVQGVSGEELLQAGIAPG